jgi:GGDEF domain-containing protein
MMITPGKQGFANGRYHSRELSADLPEYLEILTRSHRNFSVRAAQELRRAERYRLFMSLIVVHSDQMDSIDDDDPEQGRLTDLPSIIRTNCRVSDLVSGVEDGKFAVLLVETAPEGAQIFMARLKDITQSLFAGQTDAGKNISVSIELVSFPDGGANSISLAEALNILYQWSNTRPYT